MQMLLVVEGVIVIIVGWLNLNIQNKGRTRYNISTSATLSEQTAGTKTLCPLTMTSSFGVEVFNEFVDSSVR